MTFPILSVIIALPVVGAGVVLALRRRELVLPVAVASSLVTLGAAVWLLVEFEVGEAGFQFVEQSMWYRPWGVGWHLGVDGISLLLVVLTALLFPIALAASTSVDHPPRAYRAG